MSILDTLFPELAQNQAAADNARTTAAMGALKLRQAQSAASAQSKLYGGTDPLSADPSINWGPMGAPSTSAQYIPADQPNAAPGSSTNWQTAPLTGSAPNITGLTGSSPRIAAMDANEQRAQLLREAAPDQFLGADVGQAVIGQRLQGLPAGTFTPGQTTALAVGGAPAMDAYAKSQFPVIPDTIRIIDQLNSKIAELGGPQDPRALPYVQQLAKTNYSEALDPNKIAEMRSTTAKNLTDAGLNDAKIKQLQNGGLTDDTKQRMYEQMMSGMPMNQVTGNLGRGQQGANNLVDFQNYMTQQMKAQGFNGAEIAAKQVNLKAQAKAAAAAATRGSNVDMSALELDAFADQALEAAEKIKNQPFVPWNRIENMASSEFSNPDMAAYQAALQGARGAYAGVVARSGNPTVDGNHTASAILNGAQDIDAVKATLNQWKREAAAVQNSSRAVQKGIVGNVTGQGSAAPAGATTAPVQGAKPLNAPPNAQQGTDGGWYVPDPARAGKYLKWTP